MSGSGINNVLWRSRKPLRARLWNKYDYPARHTSHANVVSEEQPLLAKDKTAAAVQDDHQDARALEIPVK